MLQKHIVPTVLIALAGSAACVQAQDLTDATSREAEVATVTEMFDAPRPVARPGFVARGDTQYLTVNSPPEGDGPRQVVFTPDGSTALIVNQGTGTEPGTLTYFDVATGTITRTVTLGLLPVDVAVTPDGTKAVVPNVFSNTVSIVDLATGTAVSVPVSGSQPFAVKVTPDGATAVVAVINDAVNSQFSVIDIATATESRVIPSGSQGSIGGYATPEMGISGVLFTQFELSNDGGTIILPVRPASRVAFYDVATGVETHSVATAAGPMAVDVSADNSRVVVSHEGNTQTVTVIDLATRTLLNAWPTGQSLQSQVIRITPDNQWALAAISNNVLFVNLTTGATEQQSTGVVGDIELSFDGQYAFVSNFNSRVIDLSTRQIVSTIPFAACVESATSPTELKAVALNSRFREDIHLYSINGAASQFETFALTGEPAEGDSTRAIAITADGRTAVVGNNTSRNASIIDLDTGTVRAWVDTGDRVLDVAVTPDGRYAVVCNTDASTVSVIDLATDTEVANLSTPTRPSKVVISPDSSTAYVLTVAGVDQIYFINIAGAASSIITSIPSGQTGSAQGYPYTEISGISLSPDGSILAVAVSFDDIVRLIDTATRTVITDVVVGDFPMRVTFSPAGDRAYVSNAFSDNISVVNINGASSSTIATTSTLDFPLAMASDETGRYIYCTNSGNNPGLYVLDSLTNDFVAFINLGPSNGRGRELHYSPVDDRVYIAGSDTNGGQLWTVLAAGTATELLDTCLIAGSPAGLAVSEQLGLAVTTQPVPDGVDLTTVRAGDGCPPCAADFDQSGGVDGDDIGAFFAAWQSGAACGDVDGSGGVDGDDIGFFFVRWEAGGC